MPLRQASELLRSKDVSPVDLTRACLRRIETYNSSLKRFHHCHRRPGTGDSAPDGGGAKAGKVAGSSARYSDRIEALKDNIDTAGVRTTAASGLFKDRVPSEDAEVVRKLKQAGAVFLGQTQPPRICLRRNLRHQLLRPGPQSLGPGPHLRRLFRRFRRRHRHRPLLCFPGYRHRRLHPDPIFLLWSGRIQTHVWSRKSSRSHPALLVARPRRSHLPYC